MHDVDVETRNVSAIPGILFFIVIVALIAGFACYMVLRSHIEQLNAGTATTEASGAEEGKPRDEATNAGIGARKHSHRRHHAH